VLSLSSFALKSIAYRLRVALIGPIGSGKTHFRKVLMKERISRLRPNKKPVIREIEGISNKDRDTR